MFLIVAVFSGYGNADMLVNKNAPIYNYVLLDTPLSIKLADRLKPTAMTAIKNYMNLKWC